VFTVPGPVRYLLAFDAGLTPAVLRIFLSSSPRFSAGSGAPPPGRVWWAAGAGLHTPGELALSLQPCGSSNTAMQLYRYNNSDMMLSAA